MKSHIAAILLALSLSVHLRAESTEQTGIYLASDPTATLASGRGKPVELTTKRASKFRIVTGLTPSVSDGVSLELVGAKNHFVRHKNFFLWSDERPKVLGGFGSDATFRKIIVDGDKVRFESMNYRGHFVTAKDDGSMLIQRNPDPARSTFILKNE